MKRVTIGVHNSCKGTLIEELHEAGILQIIPIRDEKSFIRNILGQNERSSHLDHISGYTLTLDRIFEAFNEIPQKKNRPIHDFLTPSSHSRLPVNRRPLAELFSELDSVLEKLKRIPIIKSNLTEIKENLARIEKNIKSIELLHSINFELSYLGDSEFLSIMIGVVDPEKSEELIREIHDEGIDDLIISYHKTGEKGLVLIATTISSKPRLEKHVRAPRFHAIDLTCSGMPDEALAKEHAEYERLVDARETLIRELTILEQEWEERLKAHYEELKIRKEELELLTSCGKSHNVTFMEGWMPANAVEPTEQVLNTSTDGCIFVHSENSPKDEKDTPVEYDNPGWLKPFELLTTTFARPRYNEIDPTPFIAPIFVLFFGLMMGDAAYGIILFCIGAFLFTRLGKEDTGIHDMSYILIFCGISATIFGILQGGWFGDFLVRYAGISPPFAIVEPLKDPITFFQLSLIIGILHINLGIFLALYQNLKKSAYREVVFEQVVWFIIQPAAAILLAGFFGWSVIPGYLINIAYAAIAVGLVMIFYYRGPMGFFSLTGFLGDWLSYVRIMALSLATGGIAMTINILTQLIAGIHPLMILPAVLIFVGGQIFNLIIQTLGGVIHAIRLQYIEFFGKFYTGGGKKFTPFHAEREYTQLVGSDV
ncbi:MAG TPA: V-type ATP synthase subunit I [Methanoregulaceae archaeon]|nr:V-type ATP synthase subunit I [Methanoregulaceae archaeon]